MTDSLNLPGIISNKEEETLVGRRRNNLMKEMTPEEAKVWPNSWR
jgi:hypothetical protein